MEKKHFHPLNYHLSSWIKSRDNKHGLNINTKTLDQKKGKEIP